MPHGEVKESYMSRLLAMAVAMCCVAAVHAAEPLGQVTVTASRSAEERVAQTSFGVPVYEVSMSYRVSYSDLDLRTQAGVSELEARVAKAAKEACAAIDRQYAKSEPRGAACAKAAVDEAMSQIEEAINRSR
jgi:UrcA family protein